MAGLFGGARRFLQGANQPGGWTDRLALLGAGLQDASGGGGGMTNNVMAQVAARRQMAMAEEQLRQQTALEDRLRAQLSPADGPNGSGTGAAPSVEQQMAALNEARLLNPAVAQQFEGYVQGNQRQQEAGSLFANDPKAQALYRMGNQSFLDSLGEQYKPQVIGAGGRQSVYGEGRTVDAPNFTTVNDTIFRNDPGLGTSTPTATAAPSYRDVTGRISAERPQITNLSQGQQAFGVDPYGNTTPLAQNTAPRALSAGQQRQIETYYGDVEALRSINQQLGRFYTPPATEGGKASGLLATGGLNLGPWTNFGANALNMAGRSNANSRNYADFRATLEKLRNDSLRLNNGVQTEGDAQRAWNELFTNLNDEGVVTQRLAQIQEINNRAINFRQQRIAALEGQGQPQGQQGRRSITAEEARARLRSMGVAGY